MVDIEIRMLELASDERYVLRVSQSQVSSRFKHPSCVGALDVDRFGKACVVDLDAHPLQGEPIGSAMHYYSFPVVTHALQKGNQVVHACFYGLVPVKKYEERKN
jgi:hypothetical protein